VLLLILYLFIEFFVCIFSDLIKGGTAESLLIFPDLRVAPTEIIVLLKML